MSKGQQRSNREIKKPKASKTAVTPQSSLVPQTRPLPTKGQGKKPS